VGTTAEANTLYKEGTGLPALIPFSIDSAWVRDRCGKGGSITTLGSCPTGGEPTDTNNNAADFYFVDTNGTSAGGGQRLGAPSPRNLSSPLWGTGGGIPDAALDSCVTKAMPPNKVRDFTSDPANNSTFGTLDLRSTFTNNTGGNLTRLRFRVVDLTTFPAPAGIADLRPRTSTPVVVTVDRPPCGSGTSNVTVQGTTLEQPPSQPNGGGFNSTLGAVTVTLGTPLPPGATIDLRFLFGIQQTGTFKVRLVAEGLPTGGSASDIVEFEGSTEGPTPPTVTIDQAAGQSDPAAVSPINFTVVFNEAVSGFSAADVMLSGTAGASTAVVTGGPTTYNVAVSGMTTAGTVIASVMAGAAEDVELTPSLASTSTDNTVTFTPPDVTPPSVTIDQAVGQADPTSGSTINFTAVFSEPVTGFTSADVQLSSSAGATTAVVTGGPTNYNVAVSGMTASGTVIATIPAGTVQDAATNANLASTSTDNTVSYTAPDVTPPSVTIDQAAGQADPTSGATVNFTVVFSEPVTGFTSADVQLSGTAGATTAVVTGGPTNYNVAVSGMTASGTVVATIPAGTVQDAATNANLASTSSDNTVTWTALVAGVPMPIPTLAQWAMLLLAFGVLAVGMSAIQRRRGSRCS